MDIFHRGSNAGKDHGTLPTATNGGYGGGVANDWHPGANDPIKVNLQMN